MLGGQLGEAFYLACREDKEGICNYLLTIPNLDINFPASGRSIYWAYKYNMTTVVDTLLQREDLRGLDTVFENHTSFLHQICSRGDIDIFNKIKDKPLNWNVTTDENKNTPLHKACQRGRVKMIDAFQAQKIPFEINRLNIYDETPLSKFYTFIDEKGKWKNDSYKKTWNSLVDNGASIGSNGTCIDSIGTALENVIERINDENETLRNNNASTTEEPVLWHIPSKMKISTDF